MEKLTIKTPEEELAEALALQEEDKKAAEEDRKAMEELKRMLAGATTAPVTASAVPKAPPVVVPPPSVVRPKPSPLPPPTSPATPLPSAKIALEPSVDFEQKLADARDVYLREHDAYEKAKKGNSLKEKGKALFKKNSKAVLKGKSSAVSISQQHDYYSKAAYDAARQELSKEYASKEEADLRSQGIRGTELEERLAQFRIETYQKLRESEAVEINQHRVDQLSAKKKKLFGQVLEKTMGATKVALSATKSAAVGAMDLYQKAGDWGPGINLWKTGKKNAAGEDIYYRITTGKIARSAVIGAVGGLAGGTLSAGWLGLKLLNGLAISTGTGYAMQKIQSSMDKDSANFEDRKEELAYDYGHNKLSLEEYEQKLARAEKRHALTQRNHNLTRGAVLLLAGGTSIGLSAAENHSALLHLGSKDAAVGEKTADHQMSKGGSSGGDTSSTKEAIPTKTNTPLVEKTLSKDVPSSPHTILPKEAVIGKGNVSITHAFKEQLEADPKLAGQLGYPSGGTDQEKALFLKHLGEKLGYLGKNGEGIGAKAGMGEAYVLKATDQGDGSFAPSSMEYQHGHFVETHESGAAFEGSDKENYEYVYKGHDGNAPASADASGGHHAETHAARAHVRHHGETAKSDHRDDDLGSKNNNGSSPDHSHESGNSDHHTGDPNDDYVSYRDPSATVPDNYVPFHPAIYYRESDRLREYVAGFHRKGFFHLGQKAFNEPVWQELRNLRMSAVLNVRNIFRPELRVPVMKLRQMFFSEGIAFPTGERVEEYLKLIARSRAQEE